MRTSMSSIVIAIAVTSTSCIQSNAPARASAETALASPTKDTSAPVLSTTPPIPIGAAASLEGHASCAPLQAWLAAIDGPEGGPPYYAKYFAGQPRVVPVEVLLHDLAMLREESGGFVPRRIVEDSSCAVLAQRRADGLWVTLRVPPRPGPPQGAISPGLPGRDDASSLRDDEDRIRQVVAVADWQSAHDRFSGSIEISHRGKILLARAWGLASRAFRVPNRFDTKFNLGSINKMFTAVSILQLVEQKKVSLDDTVGKWLPDWPNTVVRDKVTVRMLLTHSSGLGSFFGDEFERRKIHIRKVVDYFPVFAAEPLEFSPGAQFGYSNSGFVLLGRIVEKASGEDYFDYVRRHVYAPAGMKDSDCFDLAEDIPNLAIGYTKRGPEPKADRSQWFNNLFLHVVKGGPAGGGYSTTPDLVRFAEALRSGKLLEPPTFAQMSAKQIDSRNAGYGFAVERIEARGVMFVGHTGGHFGISSELNFTADGEWAFAVMSNIDGGSRDLGGFIRDVITR